ncbi:MAG: hypothetical protein JWO72_1438 [Caulobacteraceae bacterium]|nr:hypothetical protein [Caulobacteraceae bacterium]
MSAWTMDKAGDKAGDKTGRPPASKWIGLATLLGAAGAVWSIAGSAAALPSPLDPAAARTGELPADYPRFGGDLGFGPPGVYAEFWRDRCRVWSIQAGKHLKSDAPSPAVTATLRGFVAGTISGKPDYDQMAPPMAKIVRKELPLYWSNLLRLGAPASAQIVGGDSAGDAVYVVDQKGGMTHWFIALGPGGKVETAIVCAGTGA